MLKLEKQKVTSLSSFEMQSIQGGGKARSDRRTGRCAYSRRNGVTATKHEDGYYVATGCYPGSVAAVPGGDPVQTA